MKKWIIDNADNLISYGLWGALIESIIVLIIAFKIGIF